MQIKHLLGDRILVKQQQASTETESGLKLMNTLQKFMVGEVIKTGTFLQQHSHLKPGLFVNYPRGSGEQLELGGEDYIMLRLPDVYFVSETPEMKNAELLGERLKVLPCIEKQSPIILVGNTYDLVRAMVKKRGTGIMDNNWLKIDDNFFLYYRKGSGVTYEEVNEGGFKVQYTIIKREEVILAE